MDAFKDVSPVPELEKMPLYPLQSLDLGFTKDPEKMTRKERREWYRNNKKRLGLPRWSELTKLKVKPQEDGK